MNHCFLDWNLDDDLLLTNQNKLLEPENELVELLWRNGQVVLNSQNQRKVPTINHNEGRPFCGGSSGVSSNLIHNDETAPWIQDPSEDSFEKEFCSHFLSEFSQDPIEPIKPPIKPFGDGGTINRVVKFGAFDPSNRVMPPPKFQGSENNFGKMIDFSHTEAIKCSETTAGSSHCGSNHVPNKTGVGRASKRVVGDSTGLSTGPVSNDDSKVVSLSEKQRMEVFEPARTSSSGGSGGSFGKACEQSNGDNNTNKKKKKNSNSNSNSCKRKGRDAEESECQSETAEFESSPGKKPAQRSQGSSRRSRAAEVHNLSERRRRDRINEKMKALQELIPHCNKTDKASMLDEAIEYLKSLQLQLQVMWMGSGYAAPMMFQPAYMPPIPIGGMTSPPMPSILHHAMHLQRVPLVVDQPATSATAHPSTNTLNPSMMCRTPVLNPVNYQSQMMQNMPFPEQYARFMGFQHVQAASQPMNVFRYGQPATQQSQSQTTAIPPSTSGQPFNPGQPGADDTVGGKSG